MSVLLHFDGGNEFLLELFASRATAYDFETYERTMLGLQAKGYEVIIAHPERYKAIQDDIDIAKRLVDGV